MIFFKYLVWWEYAFIITKAFLITELEGTLEGLSLDDLGEEDRGVEVGKPVTFSVDAAGAGEGTLELVVSTPSTTVKAEVGSQNNNMDRQKCMQM